MDAIAQLNKFLLKASKITDEQSKEAAMHLLSFYLKTKDDAKVAEYLMKFKQTVCMYFFEEAVKTLESEVQLQSIHSAMCETEDYKKNVNHVATTRGFIISGVLIKNKVSIARTVLMNTIAAVEKDSKFSDTVVNKFKQNVLENNVLLKSIDDLNNKPWENKENMKRFLNFMETVRNNLFPCISFREAEDTASVQPTSITTEISVNSKSKEKLKVESIPTIDITVDLAAELIKKLSIASKEASILIQSLSDANGTIDLLQKDIMNRDSRIAEFSAELNEKNRTITDLQRKLNERQQLVQECEGRIADLSERLKNSLQMDIISQNQELITLRTNLQNSLKVEYADYLVSKDGECNSDTYGALIGSLARIFKTLRRYGIIID